MPSATVAVCASSSTRSATMRDSPRAKTSSGILRLILKVCPSSVIRHAAPHRKFQRAIRSGEHDEAAIGARHVDRGVEHQDEDVVQEVAGAKGAKPFEERRRLTHGFDEPSRPGATTSGSCRKTSSTRNCVRADAIAFDQQMLARRLAAHERAVPRPAIVEDVVVALAQISAWSRETSRPTGAVAVRAASDGEWRRADGHDAPAQSIGKRAAARRPSAAPACHGL